MFIISIKWSANWRYFSLLIVFLFFTDSYVSYAQNYTIQNIEIRSANKLKTKDNIIEREMTYEIGEQIPATSLDSLKRINEARLFNLQLFNVTNVDYVISADSNLTVTVFLSERFPIWPEIQFELGDRNFNVWANEQNFAISRINLGLKLTHKNVGGNRTEISAEAQVGYTEKFSLSFFNPYISKNQKHGIGGKIAYARNKEIAINTRDNKLVFYKDYKQTAFEQTQIEVFYTYRPAYAFTHKAGIAYAISNIADTINALNPNYFGNHKSQFQTLQLRYRLDYNGVNNWNYPTEGQRGIFTLYYSHGLTDDFQQLGATLQLDKYIKVAPKTYLDFIFRGKKNIQNKETYFTTKNLGYDFNYVRGYEYFVIDGTGFALLRSDLKYELLNKKINLPIRYFQVFPIRVFPKIFADVAYTSGNSINVQSLNNAWLYGVGIGLDIVTLYDIKLIFEFTYNHLGQSDLFFHKKSN